MVDMVNDLAQYSRRQCLEIRSIPIPRSKSIKEENTDNIVFKVVKLIDIEIKHEDISVIKMRPQ